MHAFTKSITLKPISIEWFAQIKANHGGERGPALFYCSNCNVSPAKSLHIGAILTLSASKIDLINISKSLKCPSMTSQPPQAHLVQCI